jgi:hypothetical protein
MYLEMYEYVKIAQKGCFSVYIATGQRNKTVSFYIGQTVDGFF